ncbi:hypothetical protein V1514DRAFT_119589 [Lipomyces japonicus]|uniref:uncharacterized protein n=1 Tax=Lipomyces japonicus TaxID=56871 RepID=UPI0034CDAEDB
MSNRGRPRTVATRSLTFTYPGSRPHWTYESWPLPVAPGQVLVQICACTVTHTVDLSILNTQLLWAKPGEKGFGRDFVGKVVQVGDHHVADWAAGDEVMGIFYHPFGAGTLASHVLLDPSTDVMIARPAGLASLDAASFPSSLTLALQCLGHARLTADSAVCVFGGMTPVGSLVAQLAKHLFHVRAVIATGDDEAATTATAADEIVNYDAEQQQNDEHNVVQELVRAAGDRKFDLVIDTIGVIDQFMPHITDLTPAKTGFVVTTIDRDNSHSASSSSSSSWSKSLIGAIRGPRYAFETLKPNLGMLKLGTDLIVQGKISTKIDHLIGWDDYHQAFEILEKNCNRGQSVVIKVDEF